jgi:dihydroorotate dehydrogenase (NAD+) catalytic subunit
VAKAVESAGADAVSLINTLRGMVIDIAKRKPLLGNIYGGLSGPAIRPIALHMVYSVAGAVSIPVVGMGGITTSSDALEFIMAGASAVEVGTANFTNPNAPLEILEGIKQFMKEEGVSDINELIGTGRE